MKILNFFLKKNCHESYNFLKFQLRVNGNNHLITLKFSTKKSD